MKGFKKFAFNLFTKRVEVKISNINDDERIKYLALKLHDELVKKGKYEFDGKCKSITLFEMQDSFDLYSNFDGDYQRVLGINKEELNAISKGKVSKKR